MSHNPHPYKPPQTNLGELPVETATATPNLEKRQFMLSYFIAAKHNRSIDVTPMDRDKLADAASDLYERAVKMSKKLKE